MSMRGVGVALIIVTTSCGTNDNNESRQLSNAQGGASAGGATAGGAPTTGGMAGAGGTTATSSGSGGLGGGLSGGGGSAPCQKDLDCDDGLFCDGAETCASGVCQPGATPCDDQVACTVDTCDEAAGTCAHEAQDALCDDGVACNGVESCDPSMGCVVTGPNPCDDGVACTTDQCDLAKDVCQHLPNNSLCNDGSACNGVETCDPANGDPATGCAHGTPLDCDDGIACTVDSCSGSSCVHTPDNGACVTGFYCSPSQGCVPGTPCTKDADCDDGNPCNGIETCKGICQYGTPLNCNDGVPCTQDACDPATGACTHEPIDAVCDDGLTCTGVEKCTATGCVHLNPVTCDDGVDCTLDQCVEPGGTCVHLALDFACDDGNICNGTETCTPTGCQPGTPYVCPPDNDGFDCTTAKCDPILNVCKPYPDDSVCPCGQYCSTTLGCTSQCTPATCQGHIYECGDCKDNDGDCKVDSHDSQCLGPCDNTENSFYGGIPGQNNAPCKQDCYFDQDTGSGNDDCYWSHSCDPLEIAPNYPPEGSACAYDPNASISGFTGTCADAFAHQSAQCLSYCMPLTPNGCDCFGCCSIPGAPTTVWLGSENPSGTGSCNLDTVNDPTKCKPCTQVPSCLNPCDTCELCIGKTTLPVTCVEQTCPAGLQKCGMPGQQPCAAGWSCITGCCQQNPT